MCYCLLSILQIYFLLINDITQLFYSLDRFVVILVGLVQLLGKDNYLLIHSIGKLQ